MLDSTRLTEVVTCPVCLELFKEPRMLPCQHTFCLSCIKKFSGVHGNKESLPKLRCPQCRSETSMPKGGVPTLPGNIYLKAVLELVKSQEIAQQTSCLQCQTVCDVRECRHCSGAFCPICEQRHVMELEGQLKDMREQLTNSKGRVGRRIKSFSELCDQVKESIHLEIQNRVKTILELESELVRQVDDICEGGRLKGLDITQRLDSNADRILEALKEEFESPSPKTASEKVVLFLEIHQQSSKSLEVADSTTLGSLRFSPNTLTIDSEQLQEDAGQDLATPPTEQPITDRHDIAICDNAHSLYYRSRPFLPKARLGSAFLQRPAGVAVSPWSNEVYVVSMDTHRVYVFDIDRKKFLRSFGSRGQKLGEFMCPYGIALSAATQEILVTDKWKHCIHVFTRGETFTREIGIKGSGHGQFKSPESICVDREGRMYVCDTINNRIQVLDKSGNFLREIDGQIPSQGPHGLLQKKRSLFQELSGISVTPDGARLVVCDFAYHRVHVFDESGGHLFTCGQKGSLRGQFNNPECVALDERGFIFVGDCGNCRIQILRPDGRFVRSFGTKGSLMGHFNWISGLAVTPKHEIVVCDFKNHCVQIF